MAALLYGDTLQCTATLIAPRVLLTASHCLSGNGPPPTVSFASAPVGDSARYTIIDVRRHPSFDANSFTNDVALALLDRPATAAPVPLPPVPLDVRAIGAPLRLVGYGRTSGSDTSAPQRRMGTSSIRKLTGTEILFVPAPSQTCEGDSGGPAFAQVDGVEAVVGVTSTGDTQCVQMARDIRVDAYATSFIAPYVAATADGAAAAGDRCWYPESCADGTCVPALDEPKRSFCAPACGAGDACPAGLTCLADSDGVRLCRHAAPSPGAMGAACETADECVEKICAAPTRGGPTVCARTCFSDLPGFCPAGYECVPRSTGGEGCFAPAAGGCAFGGQPTLPSVLVLLAIWLFRRRSTS